MPAVVDATLAVWALLELVVRVRERVGGKGRPHRDRGTRVLVVLALGVAIATAAAARSEQTSDVAQALGILVMWLGLALRVWAIVALGGNFRTTVEVDADQAVITTGPYTWARHPSYTGLLLITAGFGVACGAWLSLVACVVLLVPALVRRIQVEEAELDHVLGEAYRTYESHTPARLIPRVW